MKLKKKLTLGFSPCPNDTFIFDALVHKRIDTLDFDFEVIIEDVEDLNKLAFAGEVDVLKISYHAYRKLFQDYCILNSGSALGRDCGPLIVARKPMALSDLESRVVSVPGYNTTAYSLLQRFLPAVTTTHEVLFSEIEDRILEGQADAGLIIHESRFTYQEKGLEKIADLGQIWESEYHLPLPLGGIVAKRDLGTDTLKALNQIVAASVEHAWNNPEDPVAFMQDHAAEMDVEVMKQHISLYVNSFTLNLGEEGKNAIRFLLSEDIPDKLGIFADEI